MSLETFRRTTQDFGEVDLEVSEARMTLFSPVPVDPDAITLDITVSTQGVPRAHPDDAPGDEPYMINHSLTTQWLLIKRADLRTRDAAALKDYTLDWKDTGDWSVENPAAIYDGSYGGVSDLRLTLSHLQGASYRLQASGRSEFDQGFVIDCTAHLDKITLRPEEGTTQAEVETALADLFDVPGQWALRGSPEFNWRDLSAAFGGDTP
jgi:hypothetical protein